MTAERKLAAILSADVVGYSRLMAEDESDTVNRLRAYRTEITNLVGEHRGRLVDFTGDNFLAEFPTATEAVEAAAEIQRVLKARNAAVPEGRAMEFRIGVHLGEVRVEGEQLYGDGVNIAARLEGLAEPGGTCISGAVLEQIRRKLELDFDDLGEQTVKNIPDPVHAYLLRERAAESPTARTGLRIGTRPVVVGLAAIAFAALGWWGWAQRAATTGPIRSIAVLPLANLSGDPGQEYFADGMTEALISSLARIGSLRVISRTSVMQYKNVSKPLPEIGRELGVDAILEGSFLREKNRIRITVQLIDAKSDSHLWAQEYERELAGVLALQSDVARAVAKSIRLELTPAEQQRLASARPIEPGAWEAYLEGRHAWDQRTAAGFDEAIRHFRRSVDLDPDSALGYTGLALAYDQQGVFGMIPPRDAARLIREQLVRALELDDSLSEVHVAAGDLDFWMWDLEGAERSYRRALELNPSNSVAHRWLAYALVATGQAAEGVAALERAIQLDPRSSSMGADAARLYAYVREYEKAEESALRTLRIDPRHADAHSTLALLYSTLGRHTEAVEAGRRAVEVSGGGDWETGFLGYSLARAGEREEATGLLEALIERSRQSYVDPIHMTRIHAGLRSGDEFFEWFERAYQTGSLWLSWVNISPVFDEVREDPRFREIARRVGLPQG